MWCLLPPPFPLWLLWGWPWTRWWSWLASPPGCRGWLMFLSALEPPTSQRWSPWPPIHMRCIPTLFVNELKFLAWFQASQSFALKLLWQKSMNSRRAQQHFLLLLFATFIFSFLLLKWTFLNRFLFLLILLEFPVFLGFFVPRATLSASTSIEGERGGDSRAVDASRDFSTSPTEKLTRKNTVPARAVKTDRGWARGRGGIPGGEAS